MFELIFDDFEKNLIFSDTYTLEPRSLEKIEKIEKIWKKIQKIQKSEKSKKSKKSKMLEWHLKPL